MKAKINISPGGKVTFEADDEVIGDVCQEKIQNLSKTLLPGSETINNETKPQFYQEVDLNLNIQI